MRKAISNLRRRMELYLRLDTVQVGNCVAGGRDHRRMLHACVCAAVRADAQIKGKERLATGGGSGHLPGVMRLLERVRGW